MRNPVSTVIQNPQSSLRDFGVLFLRTTAKLNRAGSRPCQMIRWGQITISKPTGEPYVQVTRILVVKTEFPTEERDGRLKYQKTQE